ncbi:pheromone processing endoprotease [Mortierella sp. GBA30]|nr:pheromone processing endoprotease [Mortierella sp. GBA30]
MPKRTCLLFVLSVSLVAASHSTYQSYTPKYDHDRRDYYLIRISSPYPQDRNSWSLDESPWTLHEDQQLLLGDMLGLQFESRVGLLPDYFLYSSLRQTTPVVSGSNHSKITAGSNSQHRWSHAKRSLLTIAPSLPLSYQGSRMESAFGQKVEPMSKADPIIERFYRLKSQYAEFDGNTGTQRKQKRHDLHSEIIKAMTDIEKQELRWRIKKRAPVLETDPTMPAVQSKRRGEKETGERAEQEQTEQNEDEESIEEEEQITEEDPESLKSEIEDMEKEEKVEDDANGQEEYQPKGEEQPEDDFADLFGIKDPGFRYQWHLHNTKDGHDINVTGVWEQGIIGTGVNVAIIDDGLDMTSDDLAPNFFREGSWDFNDHTALPMPRLVDDQHGTRCAGEIAAAKNDLCGLGVAYGAKVAGLRILSGQITDVDEAAALNYRFQDNHIYSCSWGPPDDGQSMDAPKGVVLDAMINGIKNGRSGLGSIYVFATGNGGSQDDDCNFDGYTNSMYTVSIGAVDRAGRHPYYSEACSAQLAVTYSNGGGSAIYTCDVGERRCFSQHGGTSAAAPIAAGMIALVLSVRPDLGWRDVQYLLMDTAIPLSLNDPDWEQTASGRLFNHKFGYGSLDAYALVEAAKTFQRLGPQTFIESPVVSVGLKIPQNGKGIYSTLTVSERDLVNDGIQIGTIEHITVTVNIQHRRRGDVEVILKSPNNIESILGARRRHDADTLGFVNWTFMTVKHWGEHPVGKYTLVVRDQGNPNYTGKLLDWRMKLWGEVKRQPANIAAKPPNDNAVEEEQFLNESPVKLDDSKDNEDDVNVDGNNPEKMDENMDIHVVVDSDVPMSKDIEKEVDKENKNEGNSSSREEIEPGKNGTTEGLSQHDAASQDKDNTDNVTTAHSWRDGIQHTKTESVVEAETEAEVSSIAGRTLYLFCAVVGLGALVIVYIGKRKRGGRGRYISVGGPAILGQGFVNGNDIDDIGLLPRGPGDNRAVVSETQPGNADISGSHADEGFDFSSDTDEDDFDTAYDHAASSRSHKSFV